MYKISILLVLLFSLVSCSDVNLEKPIDPPAQAKSVGEFCTFNPVEQKGKLIYMFIIDVSGSNRDTDSPAVRIERAMKFLEDHVNDPDVGWSLIGFDDSVYEYIGDPVYNNVTFDPSLMQAALEEMKGAHARGGTKFRNALYGAKDIVETHTAIPGHKNDKFMMFFLSDGQPQDIGSPSGVHAPVKDLLNSHPGKIRISSAFYGGYGGTARAIVEEIAKVGQGQFKDWNNTDDIDFDDLLSPGETVEAWKIDNFMVYNLNSAICRDNYYGVDSDADGLCDKDEEYYSEVFKDKLQAFGVNAFDPVRRNSVVPGISDYFVWLHFKNRLKNIDDCPVEMRVDEDHDLLNECEENLLENLNPKGTKWTSGNPLDPDTDGDGFIDGIEQLIFRDRMTSALNNLNIFGAFYDQEVANAEQQILEHRNPLYPDEDAPKYDTRVRKVEERENGQFCYSFEQSKLEAYNTKEVSDPNNPTFNHKAGENLILIYFLQSKTNNNHNGKGIYMYSVQKLKYEDALYKGPGLNINNSAFTPYLVYEKLQE